jgi:hypothetical protein
LVIESYRVGGVECLCRNLLPLSHWHIGITRHGGGVCGDMVENLVVDGCLNVASAARRLLLAFDALGPAPRCDRVTFCLRCQRLPQIFLASTSNTFTNRAFTLSQTTYRHITPANPSQATTTFIYTSLLTSHTQPWPHQPPNPLQKAPQTLHNHNHQAHPHHQQHSNPPPQTNNPPAPPTTASPAAHATPA